MQRWSQSARPADLLLSLLLASLGIVLLQATADVRQLVDNTRQLALTSALHLDTTAQTLEQSPKTTEQLRAALQASHGTMIATSRFLGDLYERQQDYALLLQHTQHLSDALADQCRNTSRTLESLRDAPSNIKSVAFSIANALERTKLLAWWLNFKPVKWVDADLVPTLDRALMDSANALWSGGKWVDANVPAMINDSLRTLAASQQALRTVSQHLEVARTRNLPLLVEQCQLARKTIDASARATVAAEQALASLQSEQVPLTVQTLRQNAEQIRNIAQPVNTAARLYVAIGWTLLVLGGIFTVLTSLAFLRR
jgi:hypothetical protein